jgi:hypothetical protein
MKGPYHQGVSPMASNFKIFIQRNDDNLHFRLMGEFDGSSAFELINTLKAHYGEAVNVVINTCGLSSIHPFGCVVFQKNCPIQNLSYALTFTGKYKDTIAPQRNMSR